MGGGNPFSPNWRDTRTKRAMDRFLFLLEGSAMLGVVWTMLTASWMTMVVGLVSPEP
jgi:hypothetical protein